MKFFLFVTIFIVFVQSQQSDRYVKYEFLRNATAKLTYGVKNNKQVFLLDPMFSKKGSLPSFAGIEKNPTVDLPKNKDIDYILKNIDAVIVGHMHADHFDMVAAAHLDPQMLIITPHNRSPMNWQNLDITTTFKKQLQELRFNNVEEIGSVTRKSIFYQQIEITQEFAEHGKGTLKRFMGGVNGIVLRAQNQPTIYWTGDTIFDNRIDDILRKYRPDIIIAHTGGAVVSSLSVDPLMMDEEQAVRFVLAAKKYNENCKIIAVHMESLDHCFTTRDKLRKAINSLGRRVSEDVIIPNDGDTVIIP